MQSRMIENLVQRFGILPGVGRKTAQRMALYLLERDREGALALAKALESAATHIKNCRQCRNLTEMDICPLCANESRNKQQVCVVETPSDVLAVEQAGVFSGDYFVLMGRLSPLDGIGPKQLGIEQLLTRVTADVEEVILATSPTVEGDATATFIAEKLASVEGLRVSRIAYGVPIGGELEYVDTGTLSHAINSRKTL